MTRNILHEIDTNQFDDSLENIGNKENSSSNRTFEIKNDNAKCIFYEIPNTPVLVRRKRRLNSKIRDEIRKSLNSTVTLRKTIERQQLDRQQLERKQQANETKTIAENNGTFIKEQKKLKTKQKICDVAYLKTIDNLLNAVNTRLEFGKINSNFKDDLKYIEIFQENVNKLAAHLHSKLKFNAGLKILKWYKSRLEIRKAKQILDELRAKRAETKTEEDKIKAKEDQIKAKEEQIKAKEDQIKAEEEKLKVRTNSAIVIQKNFRRYQAKKIYTNLLIEKLNKLQNAASIIQRNYRLHLIQKQQLNRLKEELARKDHSAKIIQRNWRKLIFKRRLIKLIELRKLIQNRSAFLIQKNWKNYVFKKRLTNLIEKRRRIQELQNLQDKSARLIQRNWRVCRFRNNLIRIINHNQQVKQESALLIQKNWKVYLLRKNLRRLIEQRKCRREIELCKNRSASIIQRTWRRYLLIKKLNELIDQRKLNVACLRIRKAWFRYKFIKQLNDQIKLKRFELEDRSALVIQSTWRMYQAKKQVDQLRFANHLQNAAQIIQRNWHCYVFRKKLANQMKINRQIKVKNAAMIISRAFRSYLDKRDQLNKQKKINAAIKIQKTWRGYVARLQCVRDHKNASFILERISEVNKNATIDQSIGQKTKIAIQKLLNYKYHDTALHFLEELEKTTNLSNESYIQMANITIIEVLLKVVSECNRSEPCLQIIKLAFSVILNIAKNEKALPLLSSISSLKEAIIETLNKHYKKTGIFLKAMTLLYILLKYENFPDSPAFTVKIKRLLSKISDNQNHPCRNRRPVYQFDPRWCSKKQIRAQFYTTRQALDAFYQIYY